MTLSLDEFRRLEYLLEANRSHPLSFHEGDELRHLLAREHAGATLMEWPDLVTLGEVLVSNREFMR